MLLWAAVIYIVTPLAAIVNGWMTLIGKPLDEDDDIPFTDGRVDPEMIDLLKLIEHFLEAIPQLILNIVFTSNNTAFLKDTEFLFGVNEFTVGVVSMVFSSVSILRGIWVNLWQICWCRQLGQIGLGLNLSNFFPGF